ncbi:DUF4355 domain-containing protein [Terribacillus saccharophilus]|uniref:DUF4355 domain-containing protein n=1 Tax=Terribacillus saccharophilus TaxID=361277 RepID=UPI0037FD775F
MTLEEIKAYFEQNKDNADVQSYLGELRQPTAADVEGFLDTEEGRKLLQPRLDSNFTKGLTTWKENNLEKLVDAEVKKRNPDKTPEQLELEKLRQELDNQKKEAAREKLNNKAVAYASENGLPTDVVSFFLGEDEDSTIKNLDLLKEKYEAAVSARVDETFDKNGRRIENGGGGGNTAASSLSELAAQASIRNQ